MKSTQTWAPLHTHTHHGKAVIEVKEHCVCFWLSMSCINTFSPLSAFSIPPSPFSSFFGVIHFLISLSVSHLLFFSFFVSFPPLPPLMLPGTQRKVTALRGVFECLSVVFSNRCVKTPTPPPITSVTSGIKSVALLRPESLLLFTGVQQRLKLKV